MFQIIFKKLTIKNFLSVGKTPITIDFQTGINVITGVNKDKEDSKNGVGKSTIVDALYFALYGTTIRDLSKDFIVNSNNKKDCQVTLTFSQQGEADISEYVITRQLAPSKCSIFKNNTDVTLSTIAKTNEYIQSIIRTPGNVFQNSVIMSLNSTLPFMVLSKIDKRKFIENVLNLQVFSEMLLYAREEYNNHKKDYEVFFTKKQTLEDVFSNNTKQISFFEENKKTRIKKVFSKIENTNNDIKAIQESVKPVSEEELRLLEDKEKKINEELIRYNNEQEGKLTKSLELKAEINSLAKQIINLENKQGVCPTCQRPLTDIDETHIQRETEVHKNSLQALKENYKTVELKLQSTKTYKEKLNNALSNIRQQRVCISQQATKNETSVEKVNFLKKTITELISEIHTIKQEENIELITTTKELENEIIELNKKTESINNELHTLDAIKHIVSEEGVKAYIVKKILEVLNDRVNFYLQELNANCTCTFNEVFEDKIVDEHGNDKTYFNFSGGEKKRIDLACLFAFLDIRRLQGDVNFSTIFYDELIDSALDEKGIELTLDILKNRYTQFNESCYIITHRGSSVIQGTDNIIHLEKRNGYTYILGST